jgi:hypothetical protein
MAAAKRRERRGAAAVETAVTLPLCFLLFAGVVNVCQTLHVKDVLTLASYESGRLASRRGVTSAEVRGRCEALLAERGVRSSTITMTPGDIANLAAGAPITIGVRASLKKNVLTLLIPSDLTVRGEVMVLRE